MYFLEQKTKNLHLHPWTFYIVLYTLYVSGLNCSKKVNLPIGECFNVRAALCVIDYCYILIDLWRNIETFLIMITMYGNWIFV